VFVTPSEVIQAVLNGDVNAIRAAATPGFRDHVAAQEMTEVLTALSDAFGSFASAGRPLVLHDVPLNFERGQAHLQVAYEGDAIAGLVIRKGQPTGRFGE
jgi:hypothetical protein